MQQLTNDLEVLAGLRERGDLTDAEFARAKAALLGATWQSTTPTREATVSSAQLEKIARQNAIAQLDREWEREREEFLVRGTYGTRRLPGEWEGVLNGVASAALGIYLVYMAFAISFWTFFPISVLLILFGVTYGVGTRRIYRRYKRALSRYEIDRQQLTRAIPEER